MQLIAYREPFLEKLSSLISKEQEHLSPDFSKVLIVLPSKRSLLYFRRTFLDACGTDAIYPPETITTENLFSHIYADNFTKKKAGKLKRIFLLKKSLTLCKSKLNGIFKNSEDKLLRNYFNFISYGDKLLKFFDELITEEADFDTLKKETLYTDYELQIEVLREIFSSYEKLLEESGYTDKPHMLKELVDNFDDKWFDGYEKIYLCGFFTLNKLETEFFKKITKSDKSKTILHTNPKEIFSEYYNPAFKHHKNIIANLKPNFLLKDNDGDYKDEADTNPQILIKELKSNFAQVSFVVETINDYLQKGINANKIAIILPDESLSALLVPVFENYGISYNLTVGHPFRETALSGFLICLNNLLSGGFYYKDVIAFLKHPFIKNAFFGKTSAKGFCYLLIKHINKENLIYLAPDTKNFKDTFTKKDGEWKIYASCAKGISGILNEIEKGFSESEDIGSLIELIQGIIDKILPLSEKKELANHPYLRDGAEKIYTISEEFNSISSDYGNFPSEEDKKSFLAYFISELEKEHITITGSPFSGIQIMGVLEARNLNFDAVILPSMNEGFFPKENPKDLFLNSQIRTACGLPTYKERESLYGLYFEEITGCAKFVSISYIKEESDSSSLPSRFLGRENLLENIISEDENAQEIIHFPYSKCKADYPLKQIIKTDDVIKRILDSGLTATSLKDYVECPARFYFKQILCLRKEEEVIEELGPLERGNFIHEALKEFIPQLYDSKNKRDENELYKILCDEIEIAFRKIGANAYSDTLMLKVAKERFRQFINNELERRDAGFTTCAENLELECETEFSIDEKIKVKLAGRIDRVDKKEEKYFLIDYKTGKAPSSKAITKIEKGLSELQLCIYAFIFCGSRNIPENKICGLGYYDLKKNFKISPEIKENGIAGYLNNSKAYIKGIIAEILDKNIPFTLSEDIKKCEYCIFPEICRINESNETAK